MKRLIVTADDFGLAPAVNEAVEQGHRRGILSAASLMVAAPAAADAVARAKRLPKLGVGLHLVLVDGRPVLPPAEIPDLVGPDGRFLADPFRAGVKIFRNPAARRQMEREMRAQLEAFHATGLALDHVNAHHHFHTHPTRGRLRSSASRRNTASRRCASLTSARCRPGARPATGWRRGSSPG